MLQPRLAKHCGPPDTRRAHHPQCKLRSEGVGNHARMDLAACSTWLSRANTASTATTAQCQQMQPPFRQALALQTH